uniref:Ribonuclease J n=1 Tax=uncultured Armatimonadetes bacterium TaxID=157466 RepID=A0A6J4JFA1_9BACT|nr:Ribonuclease J (endonuclease and 5' exonuclease) [uncultured Armatimonadetes bacterium]
MDILPQGKLRIIPLGGVGEIGKNMYAYQVLDQILVVDCGLKFPDEEMYGVDVVIPDVRWLAENRDAVQGIVLTHGHEDHIGALAYVMPQLPGVPIYGPRLALGLARGRLSERRILDSLDLREFGADDKIELGHFTVEPIQVAHSIPDSFALAIRTDSGTVIHTGDFKFDQTPVDGRLFDVPKLARISEEGVLALVSDTTNIERPGFVPSERIVGQTFDRVFREAPGRIIIASFASQIHRMQMAVDSSARFGRKVAALGRSMQTNMDMAASLGYLNVPEGIRVRADDIGSLKPKEVTILTTGSQGEPLAGLARMAADEHRQVHIQEGDTVILSATPIPGNEDAVWRVVNRLIARGANVIYDSLMPVHVSGHGNAEELKLVLNIVNPQYVVPVHGEHRMMALYAKTAEEMGWLREDIFRTEIGDVLELDENQGRVVDRIPSGSVLVDASGTAGIHEVVLRDRQHLAEDGFVVVVVAMNRETGEITSGPEILSRGFVYMDHSEELMQEASDHIRQMIEGLPGEGPREIDAIQADVRQSLKKFLEKRTNRRPMILPMIMEL